MTEMIRRLLPGLARQRPDAPVDVAFAKLQVFEYWDVLKDPDLGPHHAVDVRRHVEENGDQRHVAAFDRWRTDAAFRRHWAALHIANPGMWVSVLAAQDPSLLSTEGP